MGDTQHIVNVNMTTFARKGHRRSNISAKSPFLWVNVRSSGLTNARRKPTPYRLTSGIAANRRNVVQSDNAACKSDACSERWRTIIGDPRHSDSDRRRRSALVGCQRGPPRPARHHSVFIRRRSRRDGCSACTADLRRVDHESFECRDR